MRTLTSNSKRDQYQYVREHTIIGHHKQREKYASVVFKDTFSRNNINISSLLKYTLNDIASLEFNWDGYGGLKIKKEVIELVNRIMNNLSYEGYNLLSAGGITPTSNGTITLEFENEVNKNVTIDIGVTRTSILSCVDSVSGKGIIENNRADYFQIIKENIESLLHGN